jgi:hypothetical protein
MGFLSDFGISMSATPQDYIADEGGERQLP